MAKAKRTIINNLPYILIICGLIILVAAFELSIDKYKLLQNPSYQPICNLNPVVSCGAVMKAKQSSAFGFPNPFIGLFAAGILVTTGMAVLAGAKLKRWYWLGLELGSILGIGFIAWLFYQSLYNIHDLCPFCASVWVATITTFWYVTIYNIDQKYIHLSKRLEKPYGWVRKHHADLLILIFLIF